MTRSALLDVLVVSGHFHSASLSIHLGQGTAVRRSVEIDDGVVTAFVPPSFPSLPSLDPLATYKLTRHQLLPSIIY